MESLFVGIVLAILSGITFLAYRHPDAYRKLELPQSVFKNIMFLLICILLWNYAVSKTSTELFTLIKNSDIEKAKKIVEGITLSTKTLFVTGGIVIVFWFYLVFLHFLHEILGIKPNKDLS